MNTSHDPQLKPEPTAVATVRRGDDPGVRIALARDVITRRSLLVSDVTLSAVAFWLAALTPIFSGDANRLRPASLLLAIPVAIVAKLLGLYDNDDMKLRHTTLDETPRILALAAWLLGIVWLFESSLLQHPMSHGQRVALLVLLALLVTVGRGITRRAIVAVLPPERCLVIGSGEATDELAERFLRSHAFKAEVVDRIQSSPELYSDTWDSTRRFREMVATHKAERIIVIPESAEDLEAARAANGAGLKVSVVPSLLSTIGTSWAIDDLIGLTMLGMRTPRLTDSSRVMKRTFDLILGTVITLVLLPFMLVVAFAIKTGSSGPVIFRQKRVGRDEKEFTMLKFRTMVENADEMRDELRGRNESTGLFKITDDPRVTRVGRILRKTSLDELPQLFNVLRGEMSLVGPRPLILEEDVLLSGWARFRYRVSPGMTGPWQLGSAARFSLSDMASLDYVYVTNWSLWADVKILIRTAVYVVGMRGR